MSRLPRTRTVVTATVLSLALAGAAGCSPGSTGSIGSEPSASDAPSSPSSAATGAAVLPDGPESARLAASWLRGQLTDGLVRNEQYDVDDVGLTLDVALALEDVEPGSAQGVARAIRRPGVLRDYVGTDDGPQYAGATAKALVYGEAAGLDVSDLAGIDLVSRLEGLVVRDGPSAGRVADTGGTDYANVVSQVYAAEALGAVGSPLADEVTAYLLGQQCADGSFRGDLPPVTAADPSCDAAARALPDADATALAAGAVASPDDGIVKTETAVQDALDWLEQRQRPDGSVAGDVGAERPVPNANTTGLAGWALGRAGRIGAAGKAASWLVEHQVPAGESGALAGQSGAVAYDDAALEAPGGINRRTADQWRRATAQAVLALGYTPG